MRATILIELAGPMQSWGVQSQYTTRDSRREPTKSGVLGLICAALGRDRAEPIADLVAMPMGVRVDREGKVATDFQTAQNIIRAGKPNEYSDLIINKTYLADAVFIVGLEGESSLLTQIGEALDQPRWALGLGRKSYLPSKPLFREIVDKPLKEALKCLWPPDGLKRRFVMEHPNGDQAQRDVPIFSFATREFMVRRVTTTYEGL